MGGCVTSTFVHCWVSDVYFVPTIAYLLFSVGDYLGRIFAGRIQKVTQIFVKMSVNYAVSAQKRLRFVDTEHGTFRLHTSDDALQRPTQIPLGCRF